MESLSEELVEHQVKGQMTAVTSYRIKNTEDQQCTYLSGSGVILFLQREETKVFATFAHNKVTNLQSRNESDKRTFSVVWKLGSCGSKKASRAKH